MFCGKRSKHGEVKLFGLSRKRNGAVICDERSREKMEVRVCIGSSCHLRGSYDIINLMKSRVEENKLEDKVNLAAAFCLGRCGEGVSIKVDEQIISGVTKDNFDEVFNTYILSAV